jgi:hypothetical protein
MQRSFEKDRSSIGPGGSEWTRSRGAVALVVLFGKGWGCKRKGEATPGKSCKGTNEGSSKRLGQRRTARYMCLHAQVKRLNDGHVHEVR